jgi:hypothetical protein
VSGKSRGAAPRHRSLLARGRQRPNPVPVTILETVTEHRCEALTISDPALLLHHQRHRRSQGQGSLCLRRSFCFAFFAIVLGACRWFGVATRWNNRPARDSFHGWVVRHVPSECRRRAADFWQPDPRSRRKLTCEI